MSRVETGPMKLEDDWTGFFLRGDDAIRLALTIESYVRDGRKIQEYNLLDWATRLKIVIEKEHLTVNKE